MNTLYYTLYDNLYNTIKGTLYDNLYNTICGTLYGTLYDTLYDTLHGTLYHTLYDTLYDTLHDTLYHTLHDTSYGHAHMFRKDNFLGKDNKPKSECGKLIMELEATLPNYIPGCRSEFSFMAPGLRCCHLAHFVVSDPNLEGLCMGN